MDISFLTRFAATYDCNTYGSGTYNNNDACTTTTGTSGSSNLVNTGTNIAVGLIGGMLLIVLAIIILVKTRRKKVPQNNTK